MLAPLSVAAAQPRCVAKDVHSNARAHAELIRHAHARVVVFPELSLTGYELDANPVALDDRALDVIVEACRHVHSVALVGAPIRGPGSGTYIGVLRVDGTGATPAYRKCFLGGEEPAHFLPGDGPIVIEVDGWRAGLGICKDTGVEQHVSDNAALDIDVYLAGLVHHPHELESQERRARRIARACDAYVGFASFAGPTGGGFDQTAGVSSLWSPAGFPIARAGTDAGDFACATLTPSRDRPTSRSTGWPASLTSATEIDFRAASFNSGDGAVLAQAMRDEMAVIYDGLNLDAWHMSETIGAALGPPHGTFLVGYEDDEPICCGGVKRLDERHCELKRMYVVPPARGRGIARRLLGALEHAARELGYPVARLVTGPRQPAAQRLYESEGYAAIANFNDDGVASFFGEKPLRQAPVRGSRSRSCRRP